MNYNSREIDRIAKEITEMLEEDIQWSGIFFRIFSRCKSEASLNRKLDTKTSDGKIKYNGSEKHLRDIIGIRINLYFIDDLEILTWFFKRKYSALFVEETIDPISTTEFKPSRINLIFRIPEKFKDEFRSKIKDIRIDDTFELQLRTVLSEGWHEVDHDMRYKCPTDWDDYIELSRMFNGILASLETNEWTIIQLFDRLSYSHYKNGNISAMVRTKLRIRFDDVLIDNALYSNIKEDIEFQRNFFKLDREDLINYFIKKRFPFPPSLTNVIFLINFKFIKNHKITDITPALLIQQFKTI